MKRILFFISCCLLAICSAHAQYDGYRKPVRFGFDLGLGYANQWGNAYDSYGKKGIFSYSIGMDVDFSFMERSFIEIGVNFKRKGCRIEGHKWIDNEMSNGGPFSLRTADKMTSNLLYIQVPVLYGIELPIENSVSWKFLVGPYFAGGVAGDRRYSFSHDYEGRLSVVSSFSDDHEFGFKRFDFGAKVATGVEVGRFSYIISYELGVLNTMKEGKAWDAENKDVFDFKARNNGIMFIASVRF